jgi:oxygen-dependent protoporphyrinogen oxidase
MAAPFHVVVVGGGISGLSTAWYVEKQAAALGVPVVCSVYEAKALRQDPHGYRRARGGQFLSWKEVLTLPNHPKTLGCRPSARTGPGIGCYTNDAAREVYVLSKGRQVRLPDGVFLLVPTKFKPFILSPLISPVGKLRMGLEVFIPPRKGDEDETLGDFVTRRLGSEALDKIAEPLLSGIYNAEAQRQSLLATFPRFRETELRYGSLIRGMLAEKARARSAKRRSAVAAQAGASGHAEAAAHVSARAGAAVQGGRSRHGRPGSLFVSFVAGTEEIVAGLTRALGPRLRGEARVRGLRPAEGGGYLLEVSSRDSSAGPDGTDRTVDEVVRADAVVLATPAYDAAALLASVCPEAAGILRTVRYVSTGTISVAYKRDGRASGWWIRVLVPQSERRPLNAVTWSSTKFDHRAPEGHSLLRVFFGGSRSPRSMELDDDELLHMVKREMRSIMGIAEEPLFHRVYRWEKANAQYDVEHLRRVEAVEHALPPGIWVTGSPYRGVGLPDCVHQGQMTAVHVVEGLKGLQRSVL